MSEPTPRSPLKEATLAFLIDHGPCTDEDLAAGVLLDVHGLPYLKGGWAEAEETINTWIMLMETLRFYSIIGTGCGDTESDRSDIDHLPETCLFEEMQAREWIFCLSDGPEEAHQACEVIISMAQSAWATRYGTAADTITSLRREQWIDWTAYLYPDA